MSWLRNIGNRYRVGEDPLRTLRRIELLAVVLALLLCLQLAWGGIRLLTMRAPRPVVPAADSLQVPAVRSPAVVAAGERNEIITRPLFWGSRRPVDTVATLADPARRPGELQGVKLVGLFGSGQQAGIIALVKGEKRRILLGDTVEGWTLKSITPYELVVANGERTETLALQPGNVKADPASAASQPGRRRGKTKALQDTSAPAGDSQAQGDVAGDSDVATKATGLAPAPEAERTLGLGPGDRVAK